MAFSSSGTNLALLDNDSTSDVYVRVGVPQGDLGVQSLVSRSTGGLKGDAASDSPAIDGDVVAFRSAANNLDGNPAGGEDDDALIDVYLRNVGASTTTIASRGDDDVKLTVAAGEPAIGHTPNSLTDKRIAFQVTIGGQRQILLRDVAAGTTTVASRADGVGGAIVTPVGQPGISADGSSVLFDTADEIASLEDDRFRGVFVRRGTSTLLASRPTGLAPVTPGDRSASLYREGAGAVLARSGEVVLFTSDSDALPGAVPGVSQLYVRDLRTGAIDHVSRGDGPAGASAETFVRDGAISADGRFVAFGATGAGLPGGTNGDAQIYIRDRVAQTTVLAVPDTNGGLADDGTEQPALSADGRHLAFISSSGDLGTATNGDGHVFVRDLTTGAQQVASTGPGGLATSSSTSPAISADGRRVAFLTNADNLGSEGSVGADDVFVRDLVAGTTTLASVGTDGTGLDAASERPRISPDGTRVLFETGADDVHPLDANGTGDEFVRDLAAGTTDLVSRSTGDVAAPPGGGSEGAFAADGRHVVFTSSTALTGDDTDGSGDDAYLRDLATGQTRLLTGGAAFDTSPDDVEEPEIASADGCLAFTSRAPSAPGITNTGSPDFGHVFVRSLGAGCVADPVVPGGPGEPGPGPVAPISGTPGARDTVRPTVSRLRMTNRRFRVGRRATAVSASRARRAPQGTAFRFTLSEDARVTIAIQRALPGRRVGTSCRKPAARLRARRACTRYVSRGSLRRSLRAGARSVAFSGRVGRTALARGRYRATVTARDAAGNVSSVRRVTFTVVR